MLVALPGCLLLLVTMEKLKTNRSWSGSHHPTRPLRPLPENNTLLSKASGTQYLALHLDGCHRPCYSLALLLSCLVTICWCSPMIVMSVGTGVLKTLLFLELFWPRPSLSAQREDLIHLTLSLRLRKNGTPPCTWAAAMLFLPCNYPCDL